MSASKVCKVLKAFSHSRPFYSSQREISIESSLTLGIAENNTFRSQIRFCYQPSQNTLHIGRYSPCTGQINSQLPSSSINSPTILKSPTHKDKSHNSTAIPQKIQSNHYSNTYITSQSTQTASLLALHHP
jgi:hypothetical protein